MQDKLLLTVGSMETQSAQTRKSCGFSQNQGHVHGLSLSCKILAQVVGERQVGLDTKYGDIRLGCSKISVLPLLRKKTTNTIL